jgi:hypothetical protein
MRVGSIVPRNDVGHPTQHVHNVGDGCAMADCSNSTVIGFPGCVRGQCGGDSPLTRVPAADRGI